MKLRLQSGTRQQVLEDVDCFQGEDDSGSFGIRPGHHRFVTCLAYGLARFRRLGGEWQFLAVPGAVLWTDGAEIVLSCRSYLLDEDPDRISQAIRDQLLAEEAGLRAIKDSFQRLEEEMLRRLWSLDREGDSLEPEEKLQRRVELQARRMKQAEQDRSSLMVQVVHLGTLGLVFVLPVVGGAYLGRWLDEQAPGYSVSWTLSLLLLGVFLGGVNVWLAVRRSQ